MLAGFLLSLREGLEAALVIGIVLGALAKLKRSDLNRTVWIGFAYAIIVSATIAVALALFGLEFDGKGEMIFEGSALLLAAAVLTWMIFWMRQSAGNLKLEVEEKTHRALSDNPTRALFALTFLAVFREGVELALFLLAVEKVTSPIQTLTGALSGLACAALLGRMIFSSSRKMSLRGFFYVTNILLVFFAAGMVASSIHEFIEVGFIPALIDRVWDINTLLSNQSELGMLLKTMVGYNSTPSLSELLAYIGYLVSIITYIFVQKQEFAAPAISTGN